MAEPKGTYYSPQESGWATVLRPGPNFLGMAQQQQALAARQEQLKLQQQAKMDAEREKQVSRIAADMGKPVPTAFPWQEKTNQMLTEGLNRIQKMYLDNKPVSEIRFEAERTVADVVSYGAAAKQLFAEANGNVKKLGKEYKQDEVLKLVANKFVGPDGEPIDARKADWEDINPERAIFESPEPWNYLDENLVVKGFLNNPAFQEHAMLVQKKLDTGELGRFYRVGTETTSTKAPAKIYSNDPLTGTSQVNDADTLIENGVFDMMLGDRKMLAVVDKYVNELTSDRLVPLDEDSKDIMRAGVLADLLEKRAPGPSTMQRINEKYMPKHVSSGGGGTTKSEREAADYAAAEAKWSNDVATGSVPVLTKAVEYISKEIGLSSEARSGIEEFLGQEGDFVDMQVSPDGTIYARMKKGDKFEYKQVDRERLAGELGKNIYAETFKSTKRHYGTTEIGTAPTTQQPVPKFSIFKKK